MISKAGVLNLNVVVRPHPHAPYVKSCVHIVLRGREFMALMHFCKGSVVQKRSCAMALSGPCQTWG